MSIEKKPERKVRIRAQVSEFGYPPVHDGLVIGRNGPLGLESFQKAINFLVVTPFEHIPVEDDIVGDLLVRSAILKRIDREKLIAFVLENVKPLMSGEEILHLDLSVEVHLEEQTL